VKDRYGHGTAVTGVIAAAGNDGRGMIGLAFGAQVMIVRALNTYGQGVASELAAAILYAAESGADVINMSWGFSYAPDVPYPQVVADAIAVARGLGVVLVAAAGNDGVQLDLQRAGVPASLPGVIAVSAFNPTDERASFSTFGPWVTLAAPGAGPEDTFPQSGLSPLDGVLTLGVTSSVFYKTLRRFRPFDIVAPGYVRVAGTSVAAPYVAAAAGMLLSRHPEFTAEQVEQALRETAVDVALPGRDVQSGYGRIDVAAAVAVDSMPIARLGTPAWGARVRAPVDVVARAASPGGQLADWRLLLAPTGDPPVEIASGTTPVQDGVLASVDPATLPLGEEHSLRLEVTDTAGSRATDALPFTPLPPAPVPPITFQKVFDTGTFIDDGMPLWDATIDDLDEDGRPEIFFCTCPNGSQCPVLHVWESTGANQYAEVFSAPIPNPYVSTVCWKLATGDVDRDGHKELLVADTVAWIHVLKRVGNDAYAVQAAAEAQLNPFFANHRVWGLFVGDTNLNGEPEVVFVMGRTEGNGAGGFSDVYVFEHMGPAGQTAFRPAFFRSFQPDPEGLTGPWWSGFGDSDNDGIPEIVIGTLLGSRPHAIERFEWNPGLVTYEHKRTFPAFAQHGGAVLVADVDGDGRNELVYASEVDLAPSLLVYESTGDDAYALSFRETETLHRGLDMAVATMPGTSIPILVVPGHDGGSGPTGRLYAFAATSLAGDYANLTPAPAVIPNYVHAVDAGDFDQDGKLDVLIANRAGQPAIAIWESE
jgi:hypothetical protein